MNETNEVVAPATETPVAPITKRNSPSAEVFARVWNESTSRKDALARFETAGYTVTYSAMVARAKSYKEAGVNLKEIAALPRGRRLDVAAVNTALAGG